MVKKQQPKNTHKTFHPKQNPKHTVVNASNTHTHTYIWNTFDWNKSKHIPCYMSLPSIFNIIWFDFHVIRPISSDRGMKVGDNTVSQLVCPLHLTQARLALSTSPVSLPSPLGPQLKTLLMSSNWQRLHHFHTSTECGIKMLEAEWTIDFLLFLVVPFLC